MITLLLLFDDDGNGTGHAMRGMLLLVDVKAEVTPDPNVTGPVAPGPPFVVTMILLLFACSTTVAADEDVIMLGCLLVVD